MKMAENESYFAYPIFVAFILDKFSLDSRNFLLDRFLFSRGGGALVKLARFCSMN